MTWLDFLFICIGAVFSICLLLYASNNNPHYSIWKIINGNIKLKRGLKLLLSFFLCFLMKFGIASILMAIALSNAKFQAFYNPMKHWYIPLILPSLPSMAYWFFVTQITLESLKPKPNKLGKIAEIFQLINELTIRFWDVGIKDANTWYSYQIVKDRRNNKIINLLFEWKKLAIAFKVKSNRPLFPLRKHSKAHYLINTYKFDELSSHLRDEDLKNFLSSEFIYGNKKWNGIERRKKLREAPPNKRKRIGDYKHIDSTVKEGLTFNLEIDISSE